MRHAYNAPILAVILATLFAAPAVAGTAPDRIFGGGFQETFVIEGKAGWAVPLANATIELRFGSSVNTARAAADGSFSVGVELDQLDPADILELTARGQGAQSNIIWASPLGPAQRLIANAGSDQRLEFAEEPFVNLNPRTTVAAAMMRTLNGGQPIMDTATFERTAMLRYPGGGDLPYALAMIERGAMSLPAGADDTFAAVADPALAKALQDDFADVSGDPTAQDVIATLRTAPDVYPAAAWEQGALYSTWAPFMNSPLNFEGFMITGSQGLVIGNAMDGRAPVANTTTDPDGTITFTAADGNPFSEIEFFPYVNGVQVRAISGPISLQARLLQGPGGTLEMQTGGTYRTTYPDNPEIPSEDQTQPIGLPASATDGQPRPAVVASIPQVANRSFALPVIYRADNGDPNADPSSAYFFGMAVHHFGATGGTLERFGTSFSFSQDPDPSQLELLMDGWQVGVEFVTEESPGIWRVRVHGKQGTKQQLATGILLELQPAAAFTSANVPGFYESTINGCMGPYLVFDYCNLPLTGPSFLADGSMDWWWGSSLPSATQWADWSLGSGADAGRLVMERTRNLGGTPRLMQRRGWQLLRQDGNQFWVLENFNYMADGSGNSAPIDFSLPTSRLVRYDRRP